MKAKQILYFQIAEDCRRLNKLRLNHYLPECSLDKIFLEADSPMMFRKCLALLLVLAWVILFGTVILENFDGFGSHYHRSAHALTWSAKPAAVPIDDTDDSTDGTPHSQCRRIGAATAEPAIGLTGLQRCFKLHKIYQVFLI